MAQAIPCPCGSAFCKNWLVEPMAAWQGVSFTQEQAEAVATLLNGAVLIPITDTHITEMLIGAIESSGMTRAWCQRVELIGPEDGKDALWYASNELIAQPDFSFAVFEVIDEAKEWEGDNLKRHVLDRAALVKGFQVMAEKNGFQFGEWLRDNPDEITYDVWLQCAALGDIVYG